MPEVLDAPPAAPPKPAPPPAPPAPAPPKPAPKPVASIPTPVPDVPPKSEVKPLLRPQPKMDEMFGELGKISKPEGFQESDRPAEPKAPEPEPAEEEVPAEEAKVEELKEDATPLEKLIAEQKADRKAKAWPLVKEWRNHAVDLEKQLISAQKELSEIRSKAPDASTNNGAHEKLTQELDTIRKQLQEKEDELKYTAYERSDEYKTEYVKPYEEAWTRALSDLKGLQVTMPDGQAREIAWQDVQALANMEPDVRRKTIKEQFPDDVQEVTGHVKAIRELADKQKHALEKFRKEGDTRSQQKMEAETVAQRTRATEVLQAWNQANTEATKHEKYGKYFSPIEGDAEGNALLEAGYKKADEAFSSNPLDPKLSSEQRSELVRKQAAQRNRSAAFSRLVYMNQKLEKQVAELTKQLGEFQESEPGAGEGKPAVEQRSGSAMDRIMADIGALAGKQ